MATIIGIMGESGHGKSSSIRNLDPKTTYVIDADRKGLPFKGWKKLYNTQNKNYIQTSDISIINRAFQAIDKKEEFAHINCVIIDTLNALMVDLEMERMKEKGYDKWVDLAQDVYELLSNCLSMRNNLYIVAMCHVEDIQDDQGGHQWRIQTSGRKLQKIKLESKMLMVFFSKKVSDKYFFETQSNNSTAKSPMGLFDEPTIDNDLNYVIKKFEEYETAELEPLKIKEESNGTLKAS